VKQKSGLWNRARTFWCVYIATVNRSLTAIFFLCIGVLLAHDIFFVDAPELFSGGAELWELLYKLCLAFAATYVFYLVVVHAKRQRDKENLRPFLYAQTLRLAGEARSMIRDFKERSGHTFEGDSHLARKMS
jgi:uncharacterized membrane protein